MKYAIIDIETTGLDRFSDTITYVGIGLADEIGQPMSKYYKYTPGDSLMNMLNKIREKKLKTIFQNGKFDTLFLEINGFGKLPISHDVMLMGTSYDLVAEHGLKAMAQRYLGVPNWDISTKAKTSNSAEVDEYLRKDVQYTWELFCFFSQGMTKKQKFVYQNLLRPAYLMYRKVERRGIYIDTDKLSVVKKQYHVKQKEKLNTLLTHDKINWNSSQQVANTLFTKLSMPTLKLSKKTGKPSADAKVLKKLSAKGFDLATLLLEYKFYYGATSKFLNNWGAYAAYDGRIHPSFNVTNVITGRTSCSNPNLQQVPRNPELRNLYTAPKGKILIEADYSQIELRIAADYANETTMLKIYREGGDIHTTTAASVMGKSPKDVTKEDRSKAKAVTK